MWRSCGELLTTICGLSTVDTALLILWVPALLVSPGLLLDAVGELGNLCINRAPLGHERPDLAVRVDHGGVITSAELLPDLGRRHVGEPPAQVHRDVPGRDQHAGAAGAAQV